MNVIDGRAIYLATPRSASRSCAKYLEAHGFPTVQSHHTQVKEVLKYKQEVADLPTITLLRNPVHILYSFWWAERFRYSFEVYAAKVFRDCFNGRRLYPYWEITDEYFPYIRGVKGLVYRFGITPKSVIPQEGVRNPAERPDRSLLSDRETEIVRKYFPQDMEIYDGQVLLF